MMIGNQKSNSGKLLFILLIAIISLLVYSTASAGSLKKLHEKSFEVSSGELLTVEADCGDVFIETWNNDEVSIVVYGNRKAEDRIDFEFEKTTDGVRVIADKEGSSIFGWFSSARVRFEIKVPAKFDVDINTAGGDVKLSDLTGKMALKTSGGDLTLKNIKGDLIAKTSGGDVSVFNHTGDAKVGTSGGDIRFENANGDIAAQTSGGDINIDTEEGSINAYTSGGDIQLKYVGSNRGIELKTSGGDIDVYLSSGIEADLELYSSGGSISCDYSTSRSSKISSHKFIADLNGGGELIYCKTSGGHVKIHEL